MTEQQKKRTERLRKILADEKRRLWIETRKDLFGEQEELRNQYDIPQDPGDQSLIDVLADTNLAVKDVVREKLTRMEVVERKLREGTYGICEDCGEEIPEERLKVQPYAIRCVECQEKLEVGSERPGTM